MAKEWKKEKLSAAQRAKAASDEKKVVARNRRATHDYHIEDEVEAGVSLTGTEVKALRMGRASISEAWVDIDGGEAWLRQANIPEYASGTWTNHAPTRKRKLLMHRAEIAKWAQRVEVRGYTIVPLELYFIRGRVKVRLGLGRGKQEFDKRQAIRERQDNLEAQRQLRAYTRRTQR